MAHLWKFMFVRLKQFLFDFGCGSTKLYNEVYNWTEIYPAVGILLLTKIVGFSKLADRDRVLILSPHQMKIKTSIIHA